MLIYYTFLRHMRDYVVTISFILLPLLMIAILGASLNHEFTPSQIEPIKVALISNQEGDVATAFEDFLHADHVASLLEVSPMNDVEDGISALKSGEMEAVIFFPDGAKDGNSIEMISANDNPIVLSIVESFVRRMNMTDIGIQNATNLIDETKIVSEGKIPRGIDYYSVTTLFQFLIFGAIYGVFTITKDLGNHTYGRLQAAPIHWYKVILGKYAGSVITLFVIGVCIFIGTKLVFQANWDMNVSLIISVLLLYTMIAISLGMVIALLTKNTMISTLILFVVMFSFSFVAGSFTPMEGEWFERLSKFSPNTYVHNVIFTSIYKDHFDAFSMNVLMLMAAMSVILIFVLGRRKLV